MAYTKGQNTCFKKLCSKRLTECHYFNFASDVQNAPKSSNSDYKTKITICFLMLGDDFLYFAIILLTPSATRTKMLGSPNDSPCFGHKRKFTVHVTIHLSLFTRHYSRVLFTITVHSIILPI